MAKTAPSSKTLKNGTSGTDKPARKRAPKGEISMAGQLLRDIRAGSLELTERSERLLRRVS